MTDKPVLPNQNKVEKTNGNLDMGKKHSDADIKNPNWTANKDFSKDATREQSQAKGIDKNKSQAGSANMNNSKLGKKP